MQVLIGGDGSAGTIQATLVNNGISTTDVSLIDEDNTSDIGLMTHLCAFESCRDWDFLRYMFHNNREYFFNVRDKFEYSTSLKLKIMPKIQFKKDCVQKIRSSTNKKLYFGRKGRVE